MFFIKEVFKLPIPKEIQEILNNLQLIIQKLNIIRLEISKMFGENKWKEANLIPLSKITNSHIKFKNNILQVCNMMQDHSNVQSIIVFMLKLLVVIRTKIFAELFQLKFNDLNNRDKQYQWPAQINLLDADTKN